jgi:hypothetical protein
VPVKLGLLTRRLRHFFVAAAVVLSACTAPQLQDYANRLDGSQGSAVDPGDRTARPQSRSAFSSFIAPATDKPAKPEFVSRGSGQFAVTGDAVAAAKTFKGADGVTINLLNAPVAQAAKTIIGDVVAKELETVFGLDKDGPLKSVVRVVPNARLNSVLVMSSKPDYLDTARTWIERYEKMGEDKEEQIYAYKVQNRPAAEVADVLHKILATEGQSGETSPGRSGRSECGIPSPARMAAARARRRA